jgi:hypothetical protein
MVRTCSILLFGFLIAASGVPDAGFKVKKDLRNDWLAYSQNGYAKVDEKSTDDLSAIHFRINPAEHSGDKILIESSRLFYFLINGQVVKKQKGRITLPLDSIGKIYGLQSITFSVYQQPVYAERLHTAIVTSDATTPGGIATKPPAFFRDFVVVAGLLLVILFVVLLRVQPKLASEYFSIQRILTLREGDDTQGHARFALSSNVWYYVFCSLLLSLLLMILFRHLPDKYQLTLTFKATSFGVAFFKWIKFSVLILALLVMKVLVIFILSNLFGMRGIAGIHFFNVVRLLLIAGGGLILIGFIYFISRGQKPEVYMTLLYIIAFMFGAWILLVFLKLNNKTEHSMFHLFSYICATEVIPLLITVKVLFQ